MSAVEEYLKWYADLVSEYYDYDSDHVGGIVAKGLVERDTRITELEAENEGLRSRRLPYREAEIAQKRYEDAEAALQKQVERREEEKLRAVQAEDALAALKARRCEGCRWYQIQRHNGEYDCDHDPQPRIDSGAVHKGFCCSYWAERILN